jgi:chromate transporter
VTYLRLGATSFGGPAIVALLRRELVDRRRWLSQSEFEESLGFVQVMPGPIAVQTVTLTAWRLRGWPAALTAFAAYSLPSFVVMLALSVFYFRFAAMPPIPAIFTGLSAVIIAILADAILALVRPAVRDLRGLAISVLATAGFLAGGVVLAVLPATALLGIALRLGPGEQVPALAPLPPPGSTRRSLRTAALVAVGAAAIIVAASATSPGLLALAREMVKVNLLAFGGGYTAIALMHQGLVVEQQVLSSREFVDGLALGQITPGPVLITATFVGYRVGGLLGAGVATLAAFLPSALLLLGLAPLLARLGRSPIVQSALRGLLAGFVAMLLYVISQLAATAYPSAWSFAFTGVALVALRLRVPVLLVIVPAAVVSLLLFG